MRKILLGIFLSISFMVLTGNAAVRELNVTKEEVGQGGTLSILLDSYEDEVELVYDKEVFESIDRDSFNTKVLYKNNKFYLEKPSDLKIDLKVRNDAPKGKTTVKVNYGEETLSKDIIVEGGSSSRLGTILGIVTVICLGLGIYYYSKNKNNMETLQIITLFVIAVLTLIFFILTIVNLNSNKGSKKDETSYTILVSDDIDIIDSDEDNSDDSSDLEEKDENTDNLAKEENKNTGNNQPVNTRYNVKLNNYISETRVTEKDNDVIITFSVDITPYTEIKSVVINNNTYSVKKVGDSYQVVIKASNKYGNENYTITSIILQNGKKIDVENKQASVYILKTMPDVKNIEINGRDVVPVLNFDVEDPDNAFVSGKVVMSEITDDPSTISAVKNIANFVVKNPGDILEVTTVKVGHNSFKLPKLKESMNYDLVITLNYSLDEKKIDEKYSSKTEEGKREVFEREYNFKIVDEKINTPVSKNQELKLSFKNGEFAYKDFEKITIDGKEYNLTKNSDTGVYTVNGSIDKCTKKGKCSLHITKVSLVNDNGELKDVSCDKTIDYIYLKDEPNIVSFNSDMTDNVITGTYQIEDNDETIVSGSLIIEGPGGKETVKLEKADLTSTTFRKEVQLKKAGDYKVTLVVNYDLGDEKELKKQKESQEMIHQNIVASIKSVKLPKEKVSRGGKAELYFTIESNTDENVKTITIGGQGYSAEKQDDGTYKVIVDVPEEGDGLTRTLEVTKISYSEEVTLAEPTQITLEILKKKPKISTFDLTAVGGEISGEFTLGDEDKAVTGVKYTIDGKTVTLSKEEVKALKFTDKVVRKAGVYKVTLSLIYDLGNGVELDDVVQEKDVTVLVDAAITKSSIEPKFVKKGEEVVITYTVIHNTSSTLSKIKVNGTNYDVTHLDGDNYTVKIKISDDATASVMDFVATELTFADNEVFDLKEHKNTIQATVLKTEPAIGDLVVSYDDTGKQLTGTIEVKETKNEDTIVGGELTVTGPGLTAPKVISIGKDKLLAGSFNEKLELTKMGEYNVSLVITYDLGDGKEEKVTKTSTVKVNLKVSSIEIEAPEVVSKKGIIELVYTIVDNTDNEINKIVIDGNEKDAVYNKDADTYTIQLTEEESYGLKTYLTTGLVYKDIEGVQDVTSMNKSASVYVLKDKPTIEKISYSETEALVEITDNDLAKTAANIIFTKVQGEEEPQTFEIKDGKATISSLKNGLYNVTVEVDYDLDEDNSYEGSIGKVTKEEKNVRIVTSYDIEINNLRLNSITKNKVTLEYEIVNDTGVDVTAVKVKDKSGVEYPATFKEETGKYMSQIDNPTTRVELSIGEVTFGETGVVKELTPKEYVLINKTAPTVTIEKEIVDESKVKATISKNDPDSTINSEKYYAVLRNVDTNEEVEKILIQADTINFTKNLDGETRYRVDVVADYDLVDGKVHENEILESSDNIVINAKITLNDTYLLTPYSHPAYSDFTVKFDFESNVKLDGVIKTIKVKTTEYVGDDYQKIGNLDNEGLDYNLICGDSVRETDGENYKTTCRISYASPRQSSVLKLKALSFTYLEDQVQDVPDAKEVLVDITKWAPKITYSVENKYDAAQITFKFKFDDVSMLEPISQDETGKVYMNLDYGLKKQVFKIGSEESLEAGKEYSVTFTDVPKVSSGIRFTGTVKYDQYHHIIDKDNEKSEEMTVVSFIHFFNRQDEIFINNIELVRSDGVDVDADNVIEGDDVRLSFTVESDFVPTSIYVTTDNPGGYKFKARYTVSPRPKENEDNPYVTYVTDTPLEGFIVGVHNLQIINLYGDVDHKITKNNSIKMTIKPKEDLARVAYDTCLSPLKTCIN